MNNRRNTQDRAGAYSRLLAAAGLAMLVAVAAPRTLLAEEEQGPGTEARECMEAASADYNSCLMESTRWLHRKMCDLAYEADVVYCAAVYAGELKNAWNGVR